MPRLIHLSGYTPPQRGSFIPFLESVLGEARARGWTVEAVFPKQAEERLWINELRTAQVPVRFASGSRSELVRWLRSQLNKDDEPTILHTHFTAYDIAAAAVARRDARVKVVWHVHTVLLNDPRNVLANSVKFGLFGRSVDRILTPSDDLATAIQRRLGQRSKIEVFPSPVDAQAFPLVTAERRRESRASLGIPEGRAVLLFFGRDWQLKGGDSFLEALAILTHDDRPLIGLINQGGEAATRAAKELGVEGEIKLVGMVSRPQELYEAADVLVAPSRGEGMPFTVVEALCSGVPVVASDLPGHRFLGDRLDACTIVPNDPDRIAFAVSHQLDRGDDERREQAGAARRWIVENLDLRRATERLVGEYAGLIGFEPARTNGQIQSGAPN